MSPPKTKCRQARSWRDQDPLLEGVGPGPGTRSRVGPGTKSWSWQTSTRPGAESRRPPHRNVHAWAPRGVEGGKALLPALRSAARELPFLQLRGLWGGAGMLMTRSAPPHYASEGEAEVGAGRLPQKVQVASGRPDGTSQFLVSGRSPNHLFFSHFGCPSLGHVPGTGVGHG
jgi:hypothetical protein